jgi:hypothetical protein
MDPELRATILLGVVAAAFIAIMGAAYFVFFR